MNITRKLTNTIAIGSIAFASLALGSVATATEGSTAEPAAYNTWGNYTNCCDVVPYATR